MRAEAERDAKGAYLSYMAHELRGPLTAVTCWMDLLRDTQLSQDQREMLGVMQRSAQSLMGVINDLLELARLDAGKIELEDRPFEIRTCVEECLELHAASAATKGLELAYTVDEMTPGRLCGDAARLRQVLINLLGNAVKFTESGQVVVSVRARRLEDGRHELHVAVSDTGPGIPPDRLAAVFEEFVQAEAATARRFGGSGLGLSIVRRLVGMMGGRVWAESDGRTGTTIHFTIVARSAEGAGAAPPGRQPLLLGKRLLILYGNDTVGRMLADQVGRWGIQAHVTTQPAQAIELVRGGETFDGALIDQQVGGMDGRALAAAIARVPGADAMPLVLLTTLNGGTVAGGTAPVPEGPAIFTAYVGKPIKHARLHDVLVRMFESPRAHGSEPDPAGRAVGTQSSAMCARRERRPGGDRETLLRECAGELSGTRILVADDEPDVRRALERLMRSRGSEVLGVADGEAVLEEFGRFGPDVVLLDGQMPKVNGFETCRRLKQAPETRLTPIVMVTGLQSDADRLRSIEAGADGIVPKPFEAIELVARVRALAELKRFTDSLDRVESVLVTMARCVEGRDPETHGHCERLSDRASRLGARLKLDAADISALRLGGIVHDIGKVGVPDAILHKRGPLTEAEWVVMRRHTVEGERICTGLTAFRRVLPIIRHHHEKLDGSGYPDGLRGEEIPITARVLQVVDVYDALASLRPYKTALPTTRVLEIMRSEVDRGWWDPRVFSDFVEMTREELALEEGTALASAG